MADEDRADMKIQLEKYKNSLEDRKISLLEELTRYQEKSSSDDSYNDIYNDPNETYLLIQIKIIKALLPLLEAHINCIERDNDLDEVVSSLEFEIYKVKKKTYAEIPEWEELLDHLPTQRLQEIGDNPRGPGDLIIKELSWIKNYEDRLR